MASSKTTSAQDNLSLQAEIEELEVGLGGRSPKDIIDSHIKLLHQYNEAKDMAQALLGQLATLRKVSIKQLHEDFGLALDD